MGLPFGGTGYYEITFTSPNLSGQLLQNLPVTATCAASLPGRLVSARGLSGGVVEVQTWDTTTSTQPELPFSFVVYLP